MEKKQIIITLASTSSVNRVAHNPTPKIWGESSSTSSLVLTHTSSDYWFPDYSVFTRSDSGLCSNDE